MELKHEAGRSFARYKVHQALVRDAVSATFHATVADDPSQLVALRIAFATVNGTTDASTVRAFLDDAARSEYLDHPGIMPTGDVGQHSGYPYVAMEFSEVVALAPFLQRHGHFETTLALSLLRPLAAGIDEAHRQGIVHGAINPRTIWLRYPAGTLMPEAAVLTGFGLRHLLRRHADANRHSPALDDFLYVAPEQLRGSEPTPKSDQYALTCALHHCLTGRPPFERETIASLFGAHLFAPPPPLQGRDAPRGDGLAAVLRRGMAKEPGERFDSCVALLDAAAEAGRGVMQSPAGTEALYLPGRPVPEAEAYPRLVGRQRWRIGLVGAAFVAAILLIALMLRGEPISLGFGSAPLPSDPMIVLGSLTASSLGGTGPVVGVGRRESGPRPGSASSDTQSR